MKLFWLVSLGLPLWGLSNAVMVSTSSVASVAGTMAGRSYPIARSRAGQVFTIPRYFADKEVCGYAQPYVGGAPVTYWQSDVKNRWPADANCAAGYVKFALITLEQALSARPVAVEFRGASSSSSGGAGLTQQQMLEFTTAGGQWGASLAAGTGGISHTVSARTMLTNGQYQVLESGPLRTSILIREGPDAVNSSATRNTSFGFGCTANCVAPYDHAQWTDSPAYHSLRPSFVVTFYTSPRGGIAGNQVEADYLLDNSWMDRAQDQRIESFVLNQGPGESTPCYTAPAAFVVPFRSRVFETCWTPLAPSIQIDFNRAYVTYSKAVPAYGLNYTVGESAIELELATFNASDQGATTTTAVAPQMGFGEFTDQGAAAAGGSPTLGWTNRWSARYLVSFDPRLLNVVLGNAKAYMHAPIWYLEYDTSAAYIAGSSTPAFGRVVSLDVRPSFNSYIGDGTSPADSPKSPAGQIVLGPGFTDSPCPAPACMVTCVSKSSATLNWCSVYGTNAVNNWGEDVAHSAEAFYVAYLFTGKRVYQEAQWALGAWELHSEANGSPPPRYGRWDSKGLIYESGNTSRATAWALRNVGAAALASPDGSAEQAYFVAKLNNNLESNEGRFNITNGAFPPSDPSCGSFNINTETSVWRMSRCWYEQGWSNPLGFFMEHDPGLTQTCTGCNGAVAGDGLSPWMDEYAVLVFKWLTDVGFPAQYIHQVIATHTVHLIADSDFAQAPFDIVRYRLPNVTVGYAGYLQTYAAMKAAYITSATLAADMSASDTSFYIASLTGSGSQPGNLNNLDGTSLPYTYWQIDNEMIELFQAYWNYSTITAVNSATDQATASQHGLATGQIVRVEGSPIDPGMLGNPLCKAPGLLPNTPDNDCDFWVKAVDANTVEFYNDAALTSKVHLMGGGVNLTLNLSQMIVLTNGRGALKSAAAAHKAGAIMYRVPLIMSKVLTGDPTGSHAYIHLSGSATAVDANISTPDEGTGQTITAQNAFNALDQAVPSQNLLGGNTPNCTAAALTVNSCDNPQWAVRPRPLIRAVTVTPTANLVQISYTAPDSNACSVGISQTPFISSDSSTDTPDSGGQSTRTFFQGSLASNTSYFYRITCGPNGGAARVTGTFQTGSAGVVYQANPSNYQSVLAQLQAGDTIALAAGTYPPLNLAGLQGTPTAWITVTGPASGPPAIIAGSACCNTVEISNSSYLAIENLTINSQSIDGAFGISAKDTTTVTHDILIQNNILIGQDGSQQTDGISTKTPTWNWTIRNNTITGAGTGLYLGNSDGTDPFIGGLIENNLIQDTIGYDMEIKYQVARPIITGMPAGPSTTIIRNNVFIKNDQPSPDGDRPNVLVGGFPASGPGSNDMYEIYGNFFYHNPRESLLQADGQVSIHDNVFVDGQYAAIGLFQTDAPLNIAYVYNNTIYSTQEGIYFGSAATIADGLTGNLIFAATPISGPIASLSSNIVDSFANAPLYVNAPSLTLGSMNFYPLTGQAQGPALNLSPFAAETDYGIDFNGTPKNALLGAIVFRGAYAGQGVNPGWQLQAAIKPLSTTSGTSSLQSLQCAPSTLSPGQASTCSVTLSAPASSTSIILLVSSSTAVTVPATVNIAAGALSATFSAAAVSSGSALITATLNGVLQESTVTVIPLPIVTSLTCSPSTLVPGSSTNCTVTVSPSPGTPATVLISASSAAVTAPASVTVAAGATNAQFAAAVGSLAAAQSVTITASLNGGSAQTVLTVQASGGSGTGPAQFYFKGNNSEFAGLTNGSIVTPGTAPAGLTGTVVVRGTGSVAFSPVVNGDGVAFEGVSQGNTDTAFLSFSGAQVGSVFNVNQGDLTFYVKSSYSFAQRQALPMQNYRYVFDVYDSTGELFRFFIMTSSGRLIVEYATGSRTSGAYYYVPAGQEDAMFGLGVAAKFRLTWNGSTNVLYWNDAQVATFAYAVATPNWGASSSFVIGGTAVPPYGGGYYKCDDPIADFQINVN